MRNSLEVKTKLGSFGFFRSTGISLIRELHELGSATESGTTRLTYCAQQSVASDHARSSTDPRLPCTKEVVSRNHSP